MKLHEYQAKRLLEGHGVPVLKGAVVTSGVGIPEALKAVGGGPWVLKAQVHAGGRGKAGGVRVANTQGEAERFAAEVLGRKLVTAQTGPEGLLVRSVLVEPAVVVQRELYVAMLMNRNKGKPVLVLSAEGGVDIETLAATAPEKISRIDVDPWRGLERFQSRQAAFAAGLTGDLFAEGEVFFRNLASCFLAADASLLEINPLGVRKEERAKPRLLAMDAKVTIDDNAAFRQAELFEQADTSDVSEAEARAAAAGISYVQLDGTIGCMVNGAGLAMATMDIIKLHGGEPANFLDVGGGASVEQVTEAFKIITSDPRVRVILVNIFGGIMKCDVIAEGIVRAAKATGLSRPLVVRLEGNRVEEGRRILATSGLAITSVSDIREAAQKSVALGASLEQSGGEGPRP